MGPTRRMLVLLVELLLISGAATALVPAVGADAGDSGGRGVILIHDVYELQNMSLDPTASYALAGDIDASDTRNWNNGLGFAPIGPEFSGSLDGDGFTISGLFIDRPEDRYVGLFSSTRLSSESESIWNLTLASVNITGSEFVGALSGNNSADISDCHVTGAVFGKSQVGGLVGTCGMRNIRRCSFSGRVWSSYGPVGGIAGSGGAAILDCYSAGEVTGNDTVGGLVGSCREGQLHRSFSTASVRGISEVGGFVGANYGNISRCFSTGNVSGTSRVGGFAGYDTNAGSWVGDICDCFSTGSVQSDMRTGNPGGFIGEAVMTPPDRPYQEYGRIERCYSAGPVLGWPEPGGFMAMNQGATVVDSFWDRETSGCDFGSNGTGKGTSDMMKQATFTNWNFDTVWKIHEGASYPYLRDMPVMAENHPPTIITVPPTAATVGSLYSVQFAAPDPDGDPLAWSIASNASWLSMSGFGRLSGTPSEDDIGSYLVAVTVADGRDGNASLTFELTVSEWRHALDWSAVPPDRTLYEGDDYTFAAKADDNDPGRSVKYAVQSHPVCDLAINESSGFMWWTDIPSPGHVANSSQEYVFNLTAFDGDLTISHGFKLKVMGKPLPPELTIIALAGPDNVTVKASSVQTFSVEARSPSNATLTYEWKDNGVTVSTERTFSRKFAPGNHTLILLIGDGRYTTTRTFNFTVAQPPKTIETKPVSVPGFGAGIVTAALVVVVTLGLFWRRERR